MSEEPGRIFPGESTGLLEGRILVLEAQCAAMREALELAKTWYEEGTQVPVPPMHPYEAIRTALAPDAGKALLERLKLAEDWRNAALAQVRPQKSIRDNALEDAAKVVEDFRDPFDKGLVLQWDVAAAIRELKDG